MASLTSDLSDLLEKLKEPLCNLVDFPKLWSPDDESIIAVSELIAIHLEIDTQEIISQLTNNYEEFLEIISRQKSQDSFDIEHMQLEELLERLRCKCDRGTIGDLIDTKDEAIECSLIYSEEEQQEEGKEEESSKSDLLILPEYLKADCSEFLNVKDYAKNFIDSIIQEAEDRVNYQKFVCPEGYEGESLESDEIRTIHDEKKTEEIKRTYLMIADFTKKTGKQFILKFILTWTLYKKWAFCINFVEEQSDTCCDFFVYQVKWSLPKMSYPLPQVTANIYFTIKVCRVKPNNCPVDVWYVFETDRYKFKLSDQIRQEEFLNNIILAKLEFYKTVRA